MSQFFFIGGPCVIESEAHALRHARAISEICDSLGIPCIFKSSYDKANRTAAAAAAARCKAGMCWLVCSRICSNSRCSRALA